MQTVGVAMIAKNESALIERCLESVREADEIVVVDTGSQDDTIEKARKYTPRVYSDFQWCDSFCLARNHVLAKMTTDWVLSIDCDEVLEDFGKVREAAAMAQGKAVDVIMIAEDNGTEFRFPRLFKKTDGVYWEGAIHNTISVPGEPIGNVRIKFGYSPAHDLDKDRALRILEKEAAPPLRAWFYLGREYLYKGRYQECVDILRQYVNLSQYMAEKSEAFYIMARAFWAMGNGEFARESALRALMINTDFRECALFMATLAGKGTGVERFEKNARGWERLAAGSDNSDVLFVRQ